MACVALPPSLHSACCSGGPELTAPSNPNQSASAPLFAEEIWPLTQVCNVMIRDPSDPPPPPLFFFFFWYLWAKSKTGGWFQNYQGLTGSRQECSSSDLTPYWDVVDWKLLRLHLLPTLTEGREGMMTVPAHSQIAFCLVNAFLPRPTKITCGRRWVISSCVLGLFFAGLGTQSYFLHVCPSVLSWVCFCGEANYLPGAELKSCNTLWRKTSVAPSNQSRWLWNLLPNTK